MTDSDLMMLAVKLADQCKPENPKKTPRLGVIIADSDGKIISMAHRGKGTKDDDDHAELIAYQSAADKSRLAGATVFSTLEPCTHHVRTEEGNSCTEILVRAEVRKVYIGILDPNQGVCGKGVLGLQDAGIEVELFPHALAQEIKAQNDPFIKAQKTLTVRITDPDPEKEIPRLIFEKSGQKVTYRCHSTNPLGSDVIVLSNLKGEWWPQPGMFRRVGETNEWEFDMYYGATGPHDIYIVKISNLGQSLVGYYHKVVKLNTRRAEILKRRFPAKELTGLPGNYPGFEMSKLSKGLDKLAAFRVDVVAPAPSEG